MWAKETLIDLKGCDKNIITSKGMLKIYVKDLIKLIDMKAYGETIVENFGSTEQVAGFTLVQMIETSLISGHFVNASNEAYININSCKDYNGINAAHFTQDFFKATEMAFHMISR